MKTLSIVIPCYNEANTIREVLAAVEKSDIAGITKEIIIVDDCSTDGTAEILRMLEKERGYTVCYQEKNKGKGAAVRRGFSVAHGDYVIIQDADLEYDANEYARMIAPMLEGNADAVYGSRFLGAAPHHVLFFWHYAGNKFLTTLSNIFTSLNLTDMETGCKAFTQEAIQKIFPKLTSHRFGIEPELTACIAKAHLRLFEVGISYRGRTYKEGKKANWKDGIAAVWFVVKYNVLR